MTRPHDLKLCFVAFVGSLLAGPALAQTERELCARATGDAALAACDKAIAANPKDADSFANRGFTWSNKGDQDKAIADFNEALKINPKHARALSNRGVAWNRKGDHERAIADSTEAIKINKRYAKAYNNRGVALIRKKELDKAIVDLNEFDQTEPERCQRLFQSRQRAGDEGLALGRIGGLQKVRGIVTEGQRRARRHRAA